MCGENPGFDDERHEEAARDLEIARKEKGDGDVSDYIRKIRENALYGGFTLEDLGTTEEELQELERAGYKAEYKAEAEKWLKLARENNQKRISCRKEIARVRQCLTKANISPVKIGTCEMELAALECCIF